MALTPTPSTILPETIDPTVAFTLTGDYFLSKSGLLVIEWDTFISWGLTQLKVFFFGSDSDSKSSFFFLLLL